jgi:hypothetical protein
MIKIVSYISVLFLFSIAHFARGGNTEHHDELMEVVEPFRLALIAKDEQK